MDLKYVNRSAESMSEINNDEHEKLGTGDQVARITLKVVDMDGHDVFFRMKRSTQLKKLMYVYCDRRSCDLGSYAFMFDGCRLLGHQTPDELEMEEGDIIDAIFHTRPLGLYNIDQLNAKAIVREEEPIREEEDIAREEELTAQIRMEEEVAHDKILRVVWRFFSKLIAENSVLKEEVTRLTRLRTDEEEDTVLMKIGRNVHELMAGNSAPKEELKKELTIVKDELKEELIRLKEVLTGICEDDEGEDEEDDDEFIETGIFVSDVLEWGKKDQHLHSRL